MLKNHFKIAWRNLLRNKIFALINVIGLAIGLGSVILIGLYVHHETSYDSFFKDSERIYRMALHRVYPDRERYFASSGVMMADVLNENYEEVETATRLVRLFFQDEIEIEIEGEAYRESKYLFADSSFFNVFSHTFIHGNPETALDGPNQVVMTESTALRLFGTSDALNKTFLSDTIAITVAGVIKDIPSNSHIHFDILGSIRHLNFIQDALDNNAWTQPWLYTYLKLRKEVTQEQLESKLGKMVDTYGAGNISQVLGANYKEEGHQLNYFLQPLESIYLESNYDLEVEATGNKNYILIFSAIALILILLSGINFVNLSTARSVERAKEVGIRKVMGSHKSNLIFQFLSESILITVLSAALAIGILILLLPQITRSFGIPLDLSVLLSPIGFLSVITFVLGTGILAGLYPSFTLSAKSSVDTMKGGFKSSQESALLRNGLIVVQFFISIVMITATIGIKDQMDYVQNKELGFTRENVLVVENNENDSTSNHAFANDLHQQPEVVSVGSTFAFPGQQLGSGIIMVADQPELSDFRINTLTVDDFFMETLEFEIVKGRGFDPYFDDTVSVIINESMAKILGFDDPIGRKIRNAGTTGQQGIIPDFTIIGVVKDYHFQSLHTEITPLAIYNVPSEFNYRMRYFAIRVNSSDMQETIGKVESIWKKYSDEAFHYSFFDDNYESQYAGEYTTASIIDTFTLIAVLVSCIGLFGMTTYVMHQRMKEMSIRKVLGSSSFNIVLLFSRNFMIMVMVSLAIGVPISYYLIDWWLSGFAYRTTVSIEMFVFSGILIFILVGITLSYHALRTAWVNPVEVLKNE